MFRIRSNRCEGWHQAVHLDADTEHVLAESVRRATFAEARNDVSFHAANGRFPAEEPEDVRIEVCSNCGKQIFA